MSVGKPVATFSPFPHMLQLSYVMGGWGQRQTSLDTFSALFTATNLDTRATEPLDDMPTTEEASESPAEEDRLRFHLHRERMHRVTKGREEINTPGGRCLPAAH